MLLPEKAPVYFQDPVEFIGDRILATPRGPVEFRQIWVQEQLDWYRAVAPALLALARGEVAEVRRFWRECVKSWLKSGDIGVFVEWLHCCSPRPLYCEIAAGDSEQASEVLRAVRLDLRFNPLLAQQIDLQAKRIVSAANGVETKVRTVDDNTTHGSVPDFLAVDEVTHVQNEGFVHALLENATKSPTNVTMLCMNAGHVDSYQWRLRELAIESGRWHVQAITEPPPWIDPADLAEAEKRSRGRYARLFRGIWQTGADWIDPRLIEASITLKGPMTSWEQIREHVFHAGLDIGIRHDHSALTVLGTSSKEGRVRLALCRNWRPKDAAGEVDLAEVERAVIAAHRTYNFHTLHYDPYQGEYMAQRLRRRGIRCEPSLFMGAHADLKATRFVEAWQTQIIDVYRYDQLISDLNRMTIEENAKGQQKLVPIIGKDGSHGDCAISLACCLPAAMAGAHGGGVPTKFEATAKYSPPKSIESGAVQLDSATLVGRRGRRKLRQYAPEGGRLRRRFGGDRYRDRPFPPPGAG